MTFGGWPVAVPELQWVHGRPMEPAGAAEDEKLAATPAATTKDLAAWVDRLAQARVQATRITSPDFAAQLALGMRRPIDTVLCSVLDVDPQACVSSVVAATFPHEVHAAVTLLMRITGASSGLILLDDRVPGTWWTRLRQLTRGNGSRLVLLHHDYPLADPTVLLYSLLNRRLRPGRLPVEQSGLLIDAALAVGIGRCALLGEPMERVPVALRDHVRGTSRYCFVRRGTRVGEVMARYAVPEQFVLRASDVLRDLRVDGGQVIDTGENVIHASGPELPINPDPCVRCGWCIDSCPTRLYPAQVLEASQRQDMEQAERAGIEACIECGVCAYVCPSKLPLLEGIRKLRTAAQA
jgi:Na+-translocating ferredoxin:NAD+ oxidoreductase subunit C